MDRGQLRLTKSLLRLFAIWHSGKRVLGLLGILALILLLFFCPWARNGLVVILSKVGVAQLNLDILNSILGLVSLLSGAIAVYKKFHVRVFRPRRDRLFVVLQEPVGPSVDPNVLDYVSLVFSLVGLDNSGYKWVDRERFKSRWYRRIAVRYGGQLFKHERLALKSKIISGTSTQDGIQKEDEAIDLCVELLDERHLELAFKLRVKLNGSIKEASNDDLKKFYNVYLKHRLRNGFGIVGHAESAYTTKLGMLYGKAGLLHVSPYATEDKIENLVSGTGAEESYKGMLIVLPPPNTKQADRISGRLQNYKSILIVDDMSNEGYSSTLTESLKDKLLFKTGATHGPSIKSVAPGVQVYSQAAQQQGSGDEETGNDVREIVRVSLTGSENAEELNALLVAHVYDWADAAVIVGMYEHAVKAMSTIKTILDTGGASNKLKEIVVTDGVVSGNHTMNSNRLFCSDYWVKESKEESSNSLSGQSEDGVQTSSQNEDGVQITVAFPSPPQKVLNDIANKIEGVRSAGMGEGYYPVFGDACIMPFININREGESAVPFPGLAVIISKLVGYGFGEDKSFVVTRSAKLVDAYRMLGDPNFGYFLALGVSSAVEIWKRYRELEKREKWYRFKNSHYKNLNEAARLFDESQADVPDVFRDPSLKVDLIGPEGSESGNVIIGNDHRCIKLGGVKLNGEQTDDKDYFQYCLLRISHGDRGLRFWKYLD